MNEKSAEIYLLSKPESSYAFPFGEDCKVFKVKNKMFATLAHGSIAKSVKIAEESKTFYWMNLKCDPEEAIMLRDIFSSIIPAYHMNKTQWNTVILDGSIPQGEVERMIDNSFKLVVSKMAKKDQASLSLHL